jgi:leucyl aminopeptidase
MRSAVAVLLGASSVGRAFSTPDSQQALLAPAANNMQHGTGNSQGPSQKTGATIDETTIFAALEKHEDPVAAWIALQPEREVELAEPRLLRVMGEQEAPVWMTEGDKMRLRRQGKKFMDVTDHQDFYDQRVDAKAGKACKSSSANTFPLPCRTGYEEKRTC